MLAEDAELVESRRRVEQLREALDSKKNEKGNDVANQSEPTSSPSANSKNESSKK